MSTSRAAAPRRVADDFRPITAPEPEADTTEARERKERALKILRSAPESQAADTGIDKLSELF
jgi:hypothetical protein